MRSSHLDRFTTQHFCSCSGSRQRLRNLRAGKKAGFLRHLYIKVIVLPRQARDKHRGSTQKKPTVFSKPTREWKTAGSGGYSGRIGGASPDGFGELNVTGKSIYKYRRSQRSSSERVLTLINAYNIIYI
eukprot:COSAG06_NODE_1963_length_7972_cov_10.409628_9_plen_129_part_00